MPSTTAQETGPLKVPSVSSPDSRMQRASFCVGIDLFLPHKPQRSSDWVSEVIERWTSYFRDEYAGFSTVSEQCHSLKGHRAVVLVEFAAHDRTRQEVEQAKMWWKGIPLFGERSDAIIIDRDSFETREEAWDALLGTDFPERPDATD